MGNIRIFVISRVCPAGQQGGWPDRLSDVHPSCVAKTVIVDIVRKTLQVKFVYLPYFLAPLTTNIVYHFQ